MTTADSGTEGQIRQLAAAGLSTRQIALALGGAVSQSTVVRTLQRINSGPQPILQARKALSERLPAIARVAAGVFLVLLGVAFIVLVAAVATMAWK